MTWYVIARWNGERWIPSSVRRTEAGARECIACLRGNGLRIFAVEVGAALPEVTI